MACAHARRLRSKIAGVKQTRRFYAVLALIAVGGLVEKCSSSGDIDRPALKVSVTTPENLKFELIHGVALRFAMDGPLPDEATLFESGDLALRHEWSSSLVWSGLKPGRYFVGACYASFYFHRVTKIIDVPAHGVAMATIILPAPGAPNYLRACAVDVDGEPFEAASWVVEHRLDGRASVSHADGLAVNSRGLNYVPVGEVGDLGGGTHTVEARSRKFGRIRQPFMLGTNEVVELKFGEPVLAKGIVHRYLDSEYVWRVRVRIEYPGESPQDPAWDDLIPLNRAGEFKLPPSQLGACTVSLYVRGGGASPVLIVRQPVVVAEGMKDVSLTMPDLHRLTVVRRADDAARLSLVPIDGEGLVPAQHRMKKGTAEFNALRAGRYRVKVGEREVAVVEIPAQSEVRLP
jgi:hypothetical protein